MTDAAAGAAVLVVEDDTAMRAHLARAIDDDAQLRLLDAVGTVAEALACLESHAPGVLVADLGLPDGSGLEVIRALRDRHPNALAMAVTALGDERTVISAIEAGASGYLLKDDPAPEIAASIRELLAGGSPISPVIARFLLHRLRAGEAEPATQGAGEPLPHLSERELEVLKLVAKGFRFPEIADIFGISAHTVRTYVRRIYAKLEVHTRGEAVYEAVNLGLLRMDE